MLPGRPRCLMLAAVLLSGTSLVLGACSSPARPPSGAPGPSAALPPSALSAPPAPGTSPALSADAASGPRDIVCGPREAHIKVVSSRAADDLVAGAISWPGLRAWATASPTTNGDPATGDYKVGAEVKAGAVVKVSIPDSFAALAGLKYGQGWGYSPARSVTFHACADSDTAFIGGFHVTGPRCVPLDIAENGRPSTRVTVSFFAGPC